MIFALAAALLTALAVAAVLIPVLRRHRRAPSRADYDLTVYRDQLRELESDRARGLVGKEQEAAARTEIERRMLRTARAREAAQAEEPADAGPRGPSAWRQRAAAVGLGLCIPALAAGVYASLGNPGLPGRPFAEIERPVEEPAAAAAFRQPVERLEARLASDPNDLEGWLLLGRSYVVLQQFSEAADAFRRAATLSGGDPEVLAMLGEAIVWANEGVVVPEAAGVFRRALETRPDDPASRFHLALARAQAGEVRTAYEMWLALAADTPADAPWRANLEGLIRQAADVLDVEPGSVPFGPPATPREPEVAEAPPGPTEADVAAAADMSPDERMEMIRGMVEGLAARLEEDPNDPEGWRRLARSYAVLGEPEKALDTLRRAAEIVPDDLDTLHAYAQALSGDMGSSAPPPAAVAVYERILTVDPDDGAALWFVGLASAERGDAAAARIHWERLLTLLAPGTEEFLALQAALQGL